MRRIIARILSVAFIKLPSDEGVAVAGSRSLGALRSFAIGIEIQRRELFSLVHITDFYYLKAFTIYNGILQSIQPIQHSIVETKTLAFVVITFGGQYLFVCRYSFRKEQSILSQMFAEEAVNPASQLDQEQAEEEQIQPNKNKTDKQKQLPRQFNKAKRTLTKMVASYFTQLKQELLNGNGKFVYTREHIASVEAALSKLATIRYCELANIAPKKPQGGDDFLLSYLSESRKIFKYNLNIHNNNNQKPKQVLLKYAQSLQLPDTAMPAAYGGNAYFFDGSKFDFERMVYVPVPLNHKINLITGQVQALQKQPPFYRMKCSIIKVKRGFIIAGGYAGELKAITKQCTFFCVQNSTFYPMASLNSFHNCPSGCVHNDEVYIFSAEGMEIYNQSQNLWTLLELPCRLRCLPFQYCISVSPSQILIMGGKVCNQNSSDLKVYNTENGQVDEYPDILPVGVSCERSWGPMVVNNFVAIMSNIQASVYPQVTVKKDAVQLALVGFGGCFLNTLMCS